MQAGPRASGNPAVTDAHGLLWSQYAFLRGFLLDNTVPLLLAWTQTDFVAT